MNGIMDYNFLGIAFVDDDISKVKAHNVQLKMIEIIEMYRDMAISEFASYLDKNGLESVMGVVLKKGTLL